MNRKEISQLPNTEPRFSYGYIVVIAASIILLVSFGVFNSFGVFFKPMLTEFEWTRAAISSAFSLSFIVHGILGILMGGLNDRFGSRILITICAILIALGLILKGFSCLAMSFALIPAPLFHDGHGRSSFSFKIDLIIRIHIFNGSGPGALPPAVTNRDPLGRISVKSNIGFVFLYPK